MDKGTGGMFSPFFRATPSLRDNKGFVPDGTGSAGKVVKSASGARHFKPKTFGCKRFATEASEKKAALKMRPVTVESKAKERQWAADAVKAFEAANGPVLPEKPGKAWRS